METGSALNEFILSCNMKRLRTLHKHSQDEVASVIGVARKTYWNYEQGKRAMPSWCILRLAEFYGIPVEALYVDSTNSIKQGKESHESSNKRNTPEGAGV